MTPEDLAACTGASLSRAQRFAPALSAAMAFYSIDTPARQAAFLSQIGHESAGFVFMGEVWGPTAQQRRYERDFDAPWPSSLLEAKQDEFETNRLAWTLGNDCRGDGSKYRGHGPIQVTGKSNHIKMRDRLRERFADVPDFEADPKALMEVQWGCLSACDYWDQKGLNALADAGDFVTLTRRINGGTNGLADRLARWEAAKNTLEA
jgi:putative chitinase